MKFFPIFGCRKDAGLEARRAETERSLKQERGDLRNQVQTIQSHSRRLKVMAGALELMEASDEEGR